MTVELGDEFSVQVTKPGSAGVKLGAFQLNLQLTPLP